MRDFMYSIWYLVGFKKWENGNFLIILLVVFIYLNVYCVLSIFFFISVQYIVGISGYLINSRGMIKRQLNFF